MTGSRKPGGAVAAYIGGLVFASALITFVFFLPQGESMWFAHAIAATSLALIAFVFSIHLPIVISRLLQPALCHPSKWQRMDFSAGIPDEYRTLIVMPVLLDGRNSRCCIATLEEHYLANREENLKFCLLTDFADADCERMPEDKPILELLINGVADLNRKYGGVDRNDFILLHRGRSWSSCDGKWIGPERKRGKLRQLNQFLLSEDADGIFVDAPMVSWRRSIRYVLTLDSDNRLDRGGARALVEILAHPANSARYGDDGNVVAGYVILQPRPCPEPRSGAATLYECWARGSFAVPRLTEVAHEFSQDVFGEAAFYGKGLYDLRAFEALTNALPDNLILSHDLVEAALCRAAHVASIKVTEVTPTTFTQDCRRRHRWMRGDWQNLIWLLERPRAHRRASLEHAQTSPAKIALLFRFYIIENIRRNVSPAMQLAALLLGWLICPRPVIWTFCMLGIGIVPALIRFLMGCLGVQPVGCDASDGERQTMRESAQGLLLDVSRNLFEICVLPWSAALAVDSAWRSAWRVYVSKKNILEWTTYQSSHGPSAASQSPAAVRYWATPGYLLAWAASIVAGLAIPAVNPAANEPAIAVSLFWILGPLAVWVAGMGWAEAR
jgi:cyclic beta-1,2-glucan synthetase